MLGRRIYQRSFVLLGSCSTEEWVAFLAALTLAIGMSPVDAPKVWSYPVDGKGGNGQTIIQPITESFIALDTWPDHNGAYLFVCSCRPFDRLRVIETAAARSLKVDLEKSVDLGIPDGR